MIVNKPDKQLIECAEITVKFHDKIHYSKRHFSESNREAYSHLKNGNMYVYSNILILDGIMCPYIIQSRMRLVNKNTSIFLN